MNDLRPLTDLAEVNPPLRQSLGPSAPVSFLPMAAVGVDGRWQAHERVHEQVKKGYTAFARGDVIVAKITPCLENGKAAYLDSLPHPIGFGSTEFHVLRPRAGVDGRYLYHAIKSDPFRSFAAGNMTGTAGQRRAPASVFERFRVPLPPLPEQKRIAAILDKADAIKRSALALRAESENLIGSAYAHLVGPAHPDRARWPLHPVRELAEPRHGSMRSGPFGSALLHSEFVDHGVAVLGIDNAVQNRFAWGQRRYITPQKYEGMKRYTVLPGDVIITIMGTTGRSAVLPDDLPVAISTKHLASITVNRGLVHPEFLSNAIHRDSDVLRQVKEKNRGAIMDGLNLGLIKELEIRVPPLPLQQRFADVVAVARRADERFSQRVAQAQELFDGLASRAFRGEL